MKVERGPAALDRFSDYHRHPGPQTRTAYPPRWTLRAHPSPELRRGLAGCCRTCQNFRNPHLWFKTRGTRTVQPKTVPSCSQSFLTGHCSATAAFTAVTRVQIPSGTPNLFRSLRGTATFGAGTKRHNSVANFWPGLPNRECFRASRAVLIGTKRHMQFSQIRRPKPRVRETGE